MRKLVLLLLVSCVLFAGCAAGPHQLARSVDDWDREMYVDSPWINAVLYVVPVIPIAKWLAEDDSLHEETLRLKIQNTIAEMMKSGATN